MNVILIILTLCSQISWANLDWMNKAELIKPESDSQKLIDEIAKEIFSGPHHSDLCTVFTDSYNIHFSIGLSQETADEIAQSCPLGNKSTELSKYFKKSYYFVSEAFANLDSWTDTTNRTYIFTDQELTREKLKSIILHEIAIAIDAKSNMLLTTYWLYKAHAKNHTATTINITMPQNLNDEEEKLKKAFNLSTWSPISLTFATLRAFEFEARNNHSQYIQNHQQCVSKFNEIYSIIKKIPDFQPQDQIKVISDGSNANSGDTINAAINMLASSLINSATNSISMSNAPTDPNQEYENLDFILNQDLKIVDLNNNTVSFCEFMAQPLIVNRTLYSFFSRGPRPRTTGGVDD